MMDDFASWQKPMDKFQGEMEMVQMGGAEPSKSVSVNIISGHPLTGGQNMVTGIHIKGKMANLIREIACDGVITNEQLTLSSRKREGNISLRKE